MHVTIACRFSNITSGITGCREGTLKTKQSDNRHSACMPIVMPHLCQSQYEFEIARDVVTLLKTMKRGDTVNIEVTANGGTFDWRCSGDSQPCGPSEASRAMRKGYESVFSPRRATPNEIELSNLMEPYGGKTRDQIPDDVLEKMNTLIDAIKSERQSA